MLTRLEVDGFKNLLGFASDFGPYTCIAGVNASGKSNVFDAMQFMSLLADHTFMDAAMQVRQAGARSGDPRTLFWDEGSARHSRDMVLAAEMILPSPVVDDFGREAKPSATFVRYDLVLRYEPPRAGSLGQTGRIVLVSEGLRHITQRDSKRHLPWPHSKAAFRDAVVRSGRRVPAYISTERAGQEAGVVNVHQDGGSRGQPRKSAAHNAPRTIISTTTTTDDPTILAVRREMQSWRFLALEPSAMRSPDTSASPRSVGANGAHLASALFRLAETYGPDVYARVASASAALTDVRSVGVDYDPARDTLTLQAVVGEGPVLPARSLSDGTLRFLALCILDADPAFTGVVCMEEPENGIHPGRIEAMVELMRGLAVDPEERPGPDNPLRQVLVNTHSTTFVQFQDPDGLLFALPTTVDVDGEAHTTVRLAALEGSWRASQGDVPTITKAAISEYLWDQPGARLTLPLNLEGGR